MAEAVRMDWSRQPNVSTIRLVDLPDNPDGIFLFSYELADKIENRIPIVTILRQDSLDPLQTVSSAELTYRWNDQDRWLHLIRPER